jgi:hypothetical protein
LPVERLLRKRTGSRSSMVGPAVTTTRRSAIDARCGRPAIGGLTMRRGYRRRARRASGARRAWTKATRPGGAPRDASRWEPFPAFPDSALERPGSLPFLPAAPIPILLRSTRASEFAWSLGRSMEAEVRAIRVHARGEQLLQIRLAGARKEHRSPSAPRRVGRSAGRPARWTAGRESGGDVPRKALNRWAAIDSLAGGRCLSAGGAPGATALSTAVQFRRCSS